VGSCTAGALKVGDKVSLCIDAERRRPIAANHTATHLLNFALRSKLGSTVDQKGSIVLHDKLRFDFSWNKGMTREQIHQVDAHVHEAIAQNLKVSWKEVPLEQAREIEGLRAVFGETYPNPVRVICVGPSIDDVLKDPKNAAWRNYSIELCGGTHLSTLADALAFTITSEEAIAQGIRRVEALTGPLAQAAFANADEFEKRLKAVSDLKGNALKDAIVKLASELNVPMPAARKLGFKDELEVLRDRIRKEATGSKAEQLVAAQQYALSAIETLDHTPAPFYVEIVDLGSFNVGMTNTIKAIREKHDVPALLLSADTSKAKPIVTVIAQVPDALAATNNGLKANEWAAAVAQVLGGKGGGKPTTAQGSGPNVDKINEAQDKARAYATEKLGL
jgi:alanyl-tRNA synthetase